MFVIVFDERQKKYSVILKSVARSHNWLTIIGEPYSTYRAAERALKELRTND